MKGDDGRIGYVEPATQRKHNLHSQIGLPEKPDFGQLVQERVSQRRSERGDAIRTREVLVGHSCVVVQQLALFNR